MRLPSAVLLTALALSGLVACGGDDPADDAGAPSSTATSEESTSGTSSSPPSSSSQSSGSPGAASPGQVPRPAPGRCEPVPESADGRYVVADAGEVTLRLVDGGLQVDVSSSNGWNTSVDSDDDEADIEFSQGDDELDLEADVEAGRLVIQICADDGD